MKVAALAIVLGTVLLHAQAPPRSSAAFEVASIKPTPPNPPVTTIGGAYPGGWWTPRNVTVAMILNRAYPEFGRPGMIVGGPGWLSERHFDIDARGQATATPADYPQMIRQLLADRFQLKTHIEARPVDVYALVLARPDGSFGPQLRPASATCVAELKADRERTRAYQSGAVTERPAASTPPCNARRGGNNGMLRITAGGTLQELAASIGSWSELNIVDRTALRGDYEMEIAFDFGGTLPLGSANADTSRPSVFTAVQEQLGLKLERSRQPIDVLVIDSIELPSEN